MSRLIDWENVCLVCLQKGENRFIFGEDNDSNLIADKIMKCADILIKRDTNQPQNICLQCLDDLNAAYKFRRKCEQSDSIIKSLLNTNRREFQINNLWKLSPINLNTTQGTSIMDEIFNKAVTDDIFDDENTSRLHLDHFDTEAKFDVEDRTDAYIHNNVMELNNIKVNKSNKTKLVTNEAIYKPPRGRPKKSIEANYVKNNQRDKTKEGTNLGALRRTRGRPKKLTENSCAKLCQIMDNNVFHNTSDDENAPSIDKENDRATGNGFGVEDCTEESVHRNIIELNNVQPDQSNKTKQEVNNEVSKRPKGRAKRSLELNNVKANQNDKTKLDMNTEISNRPQGRPKKLIGVPLRNPTSRKKCQNVCEICNYKFRSQTALEVHMRRHNNERPFSCDKCGKAFVTDKELQWHVRVHTGQKPLKCRYCDSRFSNYNGKKKHEREHTGERPFACSICSKNFAYPSLLAAHLRSHTRVKKFECKECGKRFTEKVFLERHVTNHLTPDETKKSSENQQKKPLEKEIFQIEESPNSNEINIKHEIVEFAVLRDKSVNFENDPVTEARNDEIRLQPNGRLPTSRPKKIGVSPKVCGICHRILKDQNSLNGHMRRHKSGRPFSCDHCGKAFVTSAELQSHMRVHTGQKPFKCSICGNSFAHRSVLANHLKKHTGAIKFTCNECGIEFTKKLFFERHVANHLIPDILCKSTKHLQIKPLEKEILQIEESPNSNEINIKNEIIEVAVIEDKCDNDNTSCDFENDPVTEAKNDKIIPPLNEGIPTVRPKEMGGFQKVCEICNRSLKDQRSLNRHMKRHNNGRPFSCKYCAKAFVSSPELQSHMRVHTGQKPFKCSICGKSFAYRSVLANHLQSHSGAMQFTCNECGKEFHKKELLKEHLSCHKETN